MIKRKREVVDRYGNPVDDDVDVLPDGARLRVPLLFRDAYTPLQRAVMEDKATRRRGFDDSQARHKPGPVIRSDRSAARRAYEDAAREAEQAWRTPSPSTEITDGRRRRKVTTRDPFGREVASEEWEEEDLVSAPTYDVEEGRRRKKAAYDAMCAELYADGRKST